MFNRRLFVAALALGVAAGGFVSVQAESEKEATWLPFYIGTYTRGGESEGIYRSALNLQDGSLAEPQLAAKIENPSFLAITSDGKYVYSVGAQAGVSYENSGAISALEIGKDGKLQILNHVSSEGRGPCHVAFGPNKGFVYISNYSGGTFSSLPIKDDGQLAPAISVMKNEGSSINRQRQNAAHAHGMYHVPGSQLAIGADLGTDQVLIYRVEEATGKLAPNDPPHISIEPGSGPRHLDISQDGSRVYVLNELSSTIDTFQFDPQTGENKLLQSLSTLPEDFEGTNTTAEVFLHPSGKWLYCSNRGHDSLAVYQVNQEDGTLSFLQHISTQGKTPRYFGIAPGGKFLLAANQNTHNIVVYRIDQQKGTLEATPHEIRVGSPVCIQFLPQKTGAR